MNFEKQYKEYITLLNLNFGENHKIIKHSIAVAKEVKFQCEEIKVHSLIIDRAVKLALFHDFGKLEWVNNNSLSDYTSAKLALDNLNTKLLPNDISYILYLLKYLDYKIINGASIYSFPFEVLIVAYIDLHMIESDYVSLEKRKQYIYNLYFNNKKHTSFEIFWELREVFVKKFSDNFLKSKSIFPNNSIFSLSFYTGGWLYKGEYELLSFAAQEALKTNRSYIEVGSWRGKSTVLIADALKKSHSSNTLYCIDNWTGGTDIDCLRLAEKFNMKKEFDMNLLTFKNHIKPIIGLSTDKFVIEQIPDEIGFIFLDGAHDYKTIEEELLIYLPRLVKGGIICFHDTDNPRYPDVRKIINDKIVKEFNFIKQSSYLTVYQKK